MLQSVKPRNSKPAPKGPVIENSATLYGGNAKIELGNYGRKKHAYFLHGKNVFVPGVTTILKRLDKPALIQWAANQAADYFRDALGDFRPIGENGERGPQAIIGDADVTRISEAARKAHKNVVKDAADVGTQIHGLCQKIFQGDMINLPPNTDHRIHNGLKAIREWIAANDVTPIESERIILSQKWFYAGTCDLLATVNRKISVVDFKTGKAVYMEHRLQTAAYQVALEEELGEPIDDRHLVRLDKFTGECEPHFFPYSQLEIDGFLRLREVHGILSQLELEAA